MSFCPGAEARRKKKGGDGDCRPAFAFGARDRKIIRTEDAIGEDRRREERSLVAVALGRTREVGLMPEGGAGFFASTLLEARSDGHRLVAQVSRRREFFPQITLAA